MVSSVATLKKSCLHDLCSQISIHYHKLTVIIYFLEGMGVGDTHITGRHIGGGTHITSDMCAGIHISRGYTYHCDRVKTGI